MVGVSGFEPEASWTRTKRDTKLRHTPLPRYYNEESHFCQVSKVSALHSVDYRPSLLDAVFCSPTVRVNSTVSPLRYRVRCND